MRRATAVLVGAASVLLAGGSSAWAGGQPLPADGSRARTVSLVWTTITTGSGVAQRDTYRSVGSPFGPATVHTKETSNTQDRGTFIFSGVGRLGRWRGYLSADKTYVQTSANRQVIDYDGGGQFVSGTGFYLRMIRYGRVTFRGRATCTRSGCRARFTITGNAWF